jgi:hypothetical protein
MWFRKKKPVEWSKGAYRRWLRAHRPPFQWFFELDENAQELLARLGAEYVDECVEVGQQVSTEAQKATEVEELHRLAVGLAQKARPGVSTPPTPTPATSMAGMTERRAQKVATKQAERDAGRSLFGQPPDPAVGGTA